MKSVFGNAGRGVADVEPGAYILPPEEFLFVDTVFSGRTPDGKKGSPLGAWVDLDGHQYRFSRCEFSGYEWSGLVFELSSQVTVEDSLFQDCGGYGKSTGQDFVMGALTFGETCWGVARRNRFVRCGVPIMVRQSNRTKELANPPWRGPWISPEWRGPNAAAGMSNVATGELDFEGNTVDGGRVVINAGSVKGGHDPLAAMRAALPSIRFRSNSYGPGVRFDELDRTGMTFTEWRALPGRQRN